MTASSHLSSSEMGGTEGGALDADGLDIVEALVADACAAERSRGVHEGGEYYAERIIRRALEQGTLALANPPRGMSAMTNNRTDLEALAVPMSHSEALDAIIGCASTVTVLSYQEAIEGYLKLRGIRYD
jgi:hypothetical protein